MIMPSLKINQAESAAILDTGKALPPVVTIRKPVVIHILWDGDIGGIQRIVKNVFLDYVDSPMRHVAVVANRFGSIIGPGPERFCLKLKNGFDVFALLRFFSLLKSFPGAVCVYHTDAPIFRFLAPRRVSILYMEHGCTAVRKKFRRFNQFLGRRFFGRVERVICISRHIQSVLAMDYPRFSSKTLVLNNPVTMEFSAPRSAPHQPATIGFIGRFSPEKGPIEFIQCARILSRKIPKLKCVMVGDGPMLGSCIDYSKRLGIDISFKGKSENVACELEEIDVVVVPSFKDAFNMVLVEAMARGAPVVAYAAGAIPEIIINNQTGLLVPCGALRPLARAVLRVLFDIPLYAKLSLNGFNHAGEHFNLMAYRKKWDDLALTLTPSL
ncbi:MAG TPA: hypothetical protein DCO75_00005 [Fibrobacteres bacterium]|nr:hypothetical protein [Fibrobacterota bacterium]